ncbi:DUF3265 domain-containing protein [Vibrio alginolyticus]|nr:DUF3265 domain-containing protein [Vibrio alginolyticus]ELK9270668.1 DUF3265 domain-containing protein [Vibrio alginolyticus]ELN6908269.1 DUF3265 domain-containing protein [Vibrio alginolyticus]EME3981902.1 DUF3265 domain-containing protein [Vibrio alginolyticus]MBO0165532.1 DUF3265 domain-containing protein [Vibrio alginolyticus]
MGLTNASRRIRNAWHFYHALIFEIKVVCRNIALRCSPLKRALSFWRKIGELANVYASTFFNSGVSSSNCWTNSFLESR